MMTRKMILASVAFFFLALILTGCAYKSAKQGSEMDAKRVKKNIIEGKTTKQEVILEFGAPKKTLENEKIYIYEWSETFEKKVGIYGGTTTSIYQLTVIFDDNGIAKKSKIVQVGTDTSSGMGDTKQPVK